MNIRARLWLLFSQTLNALIYKGDPSEPLSARAWREFAKNTQGWEQRMYLIDGMLGQGHCQRVHRAFVERQKRITG